MPPSLDANSSATPNDSGVGKHIGSHVPGLSPNFTAHDPHLSAEYPENLGPAPAKKSRTSIAYLSVWGLAGLMATAYIFVIVAKPSMFAQFLPTQNQTAPETNEGQRAKAKAVAGVDESAIDATTGTQPVRSQPLAAAETANEKFEPDTTPVKADGAPLITITEAPASSEPIAENSSEVASSSVENSETNAQTAAIPTILNASPDSSTQTDDDISRQSQSAISQPTRLNVETASNSETPQPQPPTLNPISELADATSAIETSSVDKTTDTAATAGDVTNSTTVTIPLPERRGPVPQDVLAALQQQKATAAAAAEKLLRETSDKTTPPGRSSADLKTSTLENIAFEATTTAAAGFGEPIITRAPNSIGVVLASGPSVDALRLSWSLLSENHSGAIGTLTPRYITSQSPEGPTYTLIAGPLSNEKAAEDVCISMISRGIPCRPGTYTGNTL